MKAGIQSFFEAAGENACYAFCIGKLAEQFLAKELDPLKLLLDGIERGYIAYKWLQPHDANNFFVLGPDSFLSYLTGIHWTVTKESPSYQPKPGELVVNYWEYSSTGRVIGHFALPNWNSLIDSQTVAKGQIVSKRVFRRV